MRFVDSAFPLIVTVSAPVFDAAEVQSLAAGFERYFARGERYTVLSTSPRGAATPGQQERKLIAEWANHPRVRNFSKHLCIGSAAVAHNAMSRAALTVILALWKPPSPLEIGFHNAMSRAALTVILALWKPPSPLEIVSNLERGLDYCFRRIREERLPVSKPLNVLRDEVLAQLQDVA